MTKLHFTRKWSRLQIYKVAEFIRLFTFYEVIDRLSSCYKAFSTLRGNHAFPAVDIGLIKIASHALFAHLLILFIIDLRNPHEAV